MMTDQDSQQAVQRSSWNFASRRPCIRCDVGTYRLVDDVPQHRVCDSRIEVLDRESRIDATDAKDAPSVSKPKEGN